MKNKYLISAAVILLALFCAAAGFAQQFTQEYSADVVEKEFPLLKEDDAAIRGVFSDYKYWFEVPRHIKLQDAELTLYLSHAKELIPEISNVGISLNDTPVGGYFFTPLNADNHRSVMALPRQSLKLGFNLLNFSFFMKSSAVPCVDVNSPVNWAMIHKDSSIRLKYSVAAKPAIKYFDDIFCRITPLTGDAIAFVIDDDAGDEALCAMSIIANYLGKASNKPRDIKVLFNSNLTQADLDQYNIILLSRKNPAGAQLGDKDALVYLSRTQGTPDKYTFGIISMADTGIKKAALFLANSDMSECEEQAKVITAEKMDDITLKPRKVLPVKVTFKHLGYSDTTASGAFSTGALFRFTRPCNWLLNAGSRLDLIMSASELLVPHTSNVTVEMNGVPVATKKFTGRTESALLLRAYIPREMLDSKDFTIKTNFYFDVGQKDCNHRFWEKAWAVVKNTSYFSLPHRFKVVRDFADFPSMFMRADSLAPTIIFVPDKPSQEILSAAATVSSTVGFQLQDTSVFLEIKKAGSFDEASKKANIAFLGWPSDFSFYPEIDKYMPVKFDAQKNNFRMEEKVSRACPEKDYCVMQMSRSPFDRSKIIAAMMADGNGRGYLSGIFSGPGIYSLSGDFVYAYAPDKVLAFDVAVGKQGGMGLFGVLWFLGVVVFAGIAFLAYKMLARKK